jgi:DNA mismatch endonuclease (patch repair protein)
MDRLSPFQRSRLMAAIRGKDTKPELVVRRMVHRMGYRFRLHLKSLPGTPDLVFPRRRLAIFIHGCFWHRHQGCARSTTPKSRAEFWQAKFDANIARDHRDMAALDALGWRVAVLWECQTKDVLSLEQQLRLLLDEERPISLAEGTTEHPPLRDLVDESTN